jgi:hypothetical protein
MKPRVAIKAWLSCLNERGLLVIEWVKRQGKKSKVRKTSNSVDPFSARANEVCELIEEAGGEVIETKALDYGKADGSCSSSSASVILIFARRGL